MNTQKRKVLTIKEAAKLIDGVTEYRIRQMCVSGQLPCFMAGKKYLIAEENLYKVVFGESYGKGGEPPLAVRNEMCENPQNTARPQATVGTTAKGGAA